MLYKILIFSFLMFSCADDKEDEKAPSSLIASVDNGCSGDLTFSIHNDTGEKKIFLRFSKGSDSEETSLKEDETKLFCTSSFGLFEASVHENLTPTPTEEKLIAVCKTALNDYFCESKTNIKDDMAYTLEAVLPNAEGVKSNVIDIDASEIDPDDLVFFDSYGISLGGG